MVMASLQGCYVAHFFTHDLIVVKSKGTPMTQRMWWFTSGENDGSGTLGVVGRLTRHAKPVSAVSDGKRNIKGS